MIDINPLGGFSPLKAISVVPGKRYNYWAYVGAQNSKAALVLYFLKSNGTYCSDGLHTTGWITPASGGKTLANFTKLSLFATAPNDAVSAVIAVRKGNTTGGQAESLLFIGPAVFTEALAAQTQPTLYSTGAPTGRFASLDRLASSNVGVFMADAAIGRAQIGEAAIGRAQIGVAEIDTLRLEGEAVTIPRAASGVYFASVAFNTPVGSDGMNVVIIGTFTQGSGRNGQEVELRVDGVKVASEKPIENTTGAMSVVVPTTVGTHTYSINAINETGDMRCAITVLGVKR